MDGHLVVNYSYDAWGNPGTPEINHPDYAANLPLNGVVTINPFRYRGYLYDSETGLYYLRSRYYDPATGRFISPDSIDYLNPTDFQGLNLYAYCANDPVNYFDPTGHSVLLIISIIVGAVLGGFFGGVSASANNQNVFTGVFIGAITGAFNGLISSFSIPILLFSSFLVGAASDAFSQVLLEKKSLGDINLLTMAMAGITNAGLSLIGKGFTSNELVKEQPKFIQGVYNATINPALSLGGFTSNMISSLHMPNYTFNDLKQDISHWFEHRRKANACL